MWFETKRALLEHIGKNPNDNKLVDRMVLRGEVEVEDGGFVLIDKDAVIEELRSEISQLIEQQGKNTGLAGTNEKMESDLEEARVQWEYYMHKYEEELKSKQEIIRKCFRWIQKVKPKADWEEFRDWVLDGEQ